MENSIGIISGLVPDKDPSDSEWFDDSGVRDYFVWMARYYSRGNPHDVMNVWAYNNCQALVHVLERAGDDLTRANIMKMATSIQGLHLAMHLPGVELDTSPTDHAPLEEGYLVQFDGKRRVRMELVRNPLAANP